MRDRASVTSCVVDGRRGFTLIEVVVVIGVMMMVLGLALPPLANARRLGEATRTAAVVRSNAQLLAMYGSAHRDSFPAYGDGNLVTNGITDWVQALVDGGLIESVRETDPEGYRATGRGRIGLTGAALYESWRMVPGKTQHANESKIAGVRQGDVRYPSEKGILGKVQDVEGENAVFWTFTPHRPPRWPIAMGDESVTFARCTDFELEFDFFEYWVGHPVYSTWGGVKGRDVRK